MKSSSVIIQARIGSKRFPGKSLHPIHGKPSLQHLIDSLLQAFQRDQIWIASSESPENDVIEDFCDEQGLQIWRGEEDDVASRFVSIIEESGCESFLRLSGDSPLFDYRIAQAALKIFEAQGADMVSTALGTRHPSGMNVEVLRSDVFVEGYDCFSAPDEFEHVTKYFSSGTTKLKLIGVPCSVQDPGRYKFSLDDTEDLQRIEGVFSQMDQPHYTYPLLEKCRMYDSLSLNPGERRC